MPEDAQPSHVDLIIKTPSSLEQHDVRLTVPLDGTVGEIKAQICLAHPDKPAPATQRLIFAGRLLQDATSTAEVLRQVRARVHCLRMHNARAPGT